MAAFEKVLADTSIPEGMGDSVITALNAQRQVYAADFATYNLPQLPESEADEMYERLLDAEHLWASRNLSLHGYRRGSAETDDQLLEERGLGEVLVTAEHATDQMRLQKDGSRQPKEAEPGTAALGWILHKDRGAAFIMPRGKQTGDPNNDTEHKLKAAMAPILCEPYNFGHFSLHGTGRGQVSAIMDERSYSALLGIGYDPSPETIDAVDKIREIAKTYDLRVGVNQETLRFNPDTYELRRRSDDTPSRVTFAANNENTTRAFAQRVAKEVGKPLVTVQFELSDVLRVLPYDHPRYPGKESQRMGTYIGALFMQDCVRLLHSRG